MARFVVEDGPEIGSEYDVADGAIVGTDAQCALRLSDPTAAPRHAAVRVMKGRFLILDMGSKAGTLLNDVKVKQAALADGDRVRIGETTLLFSAGAGSMAPPAPARKAEPEPDAEAETDPEADIAAVERSVADSGERPSADSSQSAAVSSIEPEKLLEWGLFLLAISLAFVVGSLATQVILRALSG